MLSGECDWWKRYRSVSMNTMIFFFFSGISQCSCNTRQSSGSTPCTYNEKVKSILQATALNVYKTSIWKHTKKLSYIDTSFICSDEPKRLIRIKYWCKNTHPEKQQMQLMFIISNTVVTMTLQIWTQNTKIKTTSISDN